MKRLLPLAILTLTLAACVDATGISPESSRPVRGNANATLTLTEFGDLQCPACKAAHETLNKPIIAKYGQQIRFEFRQFPLRNLHRYALDLAEASECAADQKKFWEFVDMAYDKQEELGKGSIDTWAKALGLDMDLFGRCTKSHIKREAILAEYEDGRTKGVQGTPTYFVNGKQVESTLEALSAAIESGLKGAGQRL